MRAGNHQRGGRKPTGLGGEIISVVGEKQTSQARAIAQLVEFLSGLHEARFQSPVPLKPASDSFTREVEENRW